MSFHKYKYYDSSQKNYKKKKEINDDKKSFIKILFLKNIGLSLSL